ncbi:MAG TPA: hypothetical protein PKI20_11335 [Verrucomicrobiota bacterium]|nr:hypothetical protein [Verrucomicrobiota bacterium]
MKPAAACRVDGFKAPLAWSVVVACLCLAGQTIAGQSGSPLNAAVLSERLPGNNEVLASEIRAQVCAAGYNTDIIGTAILTNQSQLTTGRYDLLVLPSARALPVAAARAIHGFLQAGGDLLALGLPAWESPLFRLNGQWMSRQDYETAIASQRAQHVVEDFVQADLSRWQRTSGEPGVEADYRLVGSSGGQALHARMDRLGGWQTFGSPALACPFPPNHTLTCFRARGGPHTRQLALEWDEADGSRWIATVDLTPEWKHYTLLPDRFKAWPIETASPQRRFNPAKAVRFWVGLALSHTALQGDRHEYWFDDLGTAPNPFGDLLPPMDSNLPALESVSPGYQCYPITTPVVVRADHQKVALEEWEGRPGSVKGGRASSQAQTSVGLPLDQGSRGRSPSQMVVGLHHRARGVGFNQQRAFRWEPLLGAYDAATQDYRGALGALLVHVEPPFRGGVWAVFTPADAAFYQQAVVTNCLHQVLTRMNRGVFLTEGGSEFFTVFAGQQFTAGARVANFGRETVSNLHVAVQFLDAKGRAQWTALDRELALAPGEIRAVEQGGLSKKPGEAGVSVALTLAGTPIDGLRHELGVWEPKAKPEYIQARDGGLWLRGKPWKAHGVNYMPSSGIGLANGRYFEHWLGRGAYDPEVIERDLRRIKALNLNAVSVFIYHESLQAQHLLDLLRRCEALGLRVNQSLRPGTPMNFRWREMKELIEYYRLAQNDTVFAYDLAWEPTHGSHEQQQNAYALLWNDWVLKRYGTLDAATNAWSFPAPYSALRPPHLAVPSMSQLTADGEWRKLVADYRLFLDDLLREKYGAARQLVKSVDPHHAVSFRMTCAGDPLYNWDAALTYDFYGLAGAVDIWEPEAYGRIGDWERVRPGAFTAAYARLCDPAKPLIWAEMGYSVWDINKMAPDREKLAFAGRYYADFYRMMIQSGADGVFFWWYPGGFRLGENSDFGIINPDGTDRPVTKVICSQGPRFLRAPKPPKPSYWIAVNRDRDPRGLFGIYQAVRADFWKALDEHRRPGLKWESRPGTTE